MLNKKVVRKITAEGNKSPDFRKAIPTPTANASILVAKPSVAIVLFEREVTADESVSSFLND